MIEILNRWTQAVIYRSEDATTIAEAMALALKARANLSGANISGANLSGANISGANLFRADLFRADLSGANLYGANLYGANLYGANLSRADLSGANLFRANLSRANLSGANLFGANLYGANLSGANLFRANISGANLSGANISGADLSGAVGANPMLIDQLRSVLLDQGEITAYRLVTAAGGSPMHPTSITYEVGKEYEVHDASTDESQMCAAGLHCATFAWCLREWKPGWRILRVMHNREDIAAIPLGTDGKWRVHRLRVIDEVPMSEWGDGPWTDKREVAA